jgi:hypothetical protein
MNGLGDFREGISEIVSNSPQGFWLMEGAGNFAEGFCEIDGPGNSSEGF